MPRYIDAELFIDKLEEKMRMVEEPYQLTEGEKNFNFGLELATEIAFNMPTTDVVEVMRCEDCKWWKLSEYSMLGIHVCQMFSGAREEHDFCSRGERKEDE